MAEQFESTHIDIIELNIEDVHWVEQGRELLINGHLFDVKKISIIDGRQVRVEGLFDFKEDKLYAHLKQSLHNSKTEAKNSLFPLLYFQLFFEKQNLNTAYADHISSKGKEIFSYIPTYIPLIYCTVDTPPPNA